MTTRKIHIILGPPLSGKSTFIESQFDTALGDIIVRPGNFLRSAVGIGRMVADPNPNACECTDNWVNYMMTGAFQFQKQNGGVLVLDGYPRKVGQAKQLFQFLKTFNLARDFSQFENTICTHVLTLSERDVESRILGRPEAERDFDRKRIKVSNQQIESVLDALMSFSSHVNKVQINYVTERSFSKIRRPEDPGGSSSGTNPSR